MNIYAKPYDTRLEIQALDRIYEGDREKMRAAAQHHWEKWSDDTVYLNANPADALAKITHWYDVLVALE